MHSTIKSRVRILFILIALLLAVLLVRLGFLML